MAKIFTNVRPGELISADLMNDILDELNSLEARVSALQALPGTQGNVVVTDLQPSHTMRVGQTLTLVGRNFVSPPENNTVTVASIKISADLFRFNSDESHLIFVLPPVPGLDNMSQPVDVQVSNQHGMAPPVPLTLLPALVAPQGRLEVLYAVAPVMEFTKPNIESGKSYIFQFSVTAFVTIDSTYQLTATLPDWNPQLLNDSDDNVRVSNAIPIPGGLGGVTRIIRARVTAPPAPASGSLRLDVIETSGFGQVNPGNSSTNPIAVNSPPPTPETRVRPSIRSVLPLPAQIAGSKAQFKRTNAGAITLNFSFTTNNTANNPGSFKLSAELRNPKGWLPDGTTLTIDPINITAPPAGQDAVVMLNPGAGATATDLIITVVSTAGVTPPLNVKYALGLTVVD